MALQNGMQVAITSFSVQTDLMQQALELSIPLARNIPIRGGRNISEREGKRKQLKDAIHDVSVSSGETPLSPSNTILIDDDENNVNKAKEDGYWSLWFDPENSDDIFNSLIALAE